MVGVITLRERFKVKGQMSDTFCTAFFIILSGGFQDAYTYCSRGGVFANAQTGNIVLMSSALLDGNYAKAIKYLIPIVSFILGIAVAEIVHMKYKHYEKIHWRQMILIGEIVLLFVVGFFPHSIDPIADALVSFVCALQVQTFHKVRGHAYASTMCIGNMRSGTEALCAYFHTRDKAILYKALTYFAVILVFALGAGLGSLITKLTDDKSIWICCVLLLISFIMMFKSEKIKDKG